MLAAEIMQKFFVSPRGTEGSAAHVNVLSVYSLVTNIALTVPQFPALSFALA
jgi:hypothetical protein